jgi:putative membrane protein
MPEPDGPSLRDHYAAERTLLAWMRTGLAMMGFGFLVARFATAGTQTIAAWFGSALVICGALANALALVDYRHEVRRLGASGLPRPASRMATAIAALLVITGVLMAVYLVLLVP